MKTKTIISTVIGVASLITGEVMAQTASETDALVVSYNNDTKIAQMRDLTTGETVESFPTIDVFPGALVVIQKLASNKGIIIAFRHIEGVKVGGFHS